MRQIRCFYEIDPGFPATDQHPDAARYPINVGVFRFVDAVGGEPTAEEIAAVLAPPAVELTPAEKLAAFLRDNPDVAALVS